ncbi:Hypothetical protein D9617_3g021110 [Elsinoe fawcettii]|nr:Hypothetical protein D9617_3g021110 [Elsinoe fawcettii]
MHLHHFLAGVAAIPMACLAHPVEPSLIDLSLPGDEVSRPDHEPTADRSITPRTSALLERQYVSMLLDAYFGEVLGLIFYDIFTPWREHLGRHPDQKVRKQGIVALMNREPPWCEKIRGMLKAAREWSPKEDYNLAKPMDTCSNAGLLWNYAVAKANLGPRLKLEPPACATLEPFLSQLTAASVGGKENAYHVSCTDMQNIYADLHGILKETVQPA